MESQTVVAIALPVLVGAALIALATLVLRNSQGGRHNRYFATLFILSGLKSISEGVDQVAGSFHASAPLFPPTLFWQLLAFFCAMVMLPLLFLFVATFPRPVGWLVRRPWLASLAFVPSVVVAWLLLLAFLDPAWFARYETGIQAFNALGTVVTLVALALLLRTRKRSPSAIERKQATYVAVGFFPAFLAGWILTAGTWGVQGGLVAAATMERLVEDMTHVLLPLFELLAAGLVGFAILKYNLFGIQQRFKIGVRSFAAGFLLIAVFLLTQVVENVVLQGKVFAFAGDYGSFLLSGVIGLVLFRPIQAASGKVSERLLPKEDAATVRAAEVYQAQCTYVLRDAMVTDRELRLLRNLRQQLGLTDEKAREIEQMVETSLRVDNPHVGASRAAEADPVPAAANAE